jgi:hypothetical protein
MKAEKTYLLQLGDTELGPLTLVQLNQMRSRGEIEATALCRASDSADYRELAEMFPHMAHFVPRLPVEREAETYLMNLPHHMASSSAVAALVELMQGSGILQTLLAIFAVGCGAYAFGMKAGVRAFVGMGVGFAILGHLVAEWWIELNGG